MNILLSMLSFSSLYRASLKTALKPFKTQWTPSSIHQCTDKEYITHATQRFITPRCHETRLPFFDQSSGLIINADAYLTNYNTLCALLDEPTTIADAKLILRAYQRFGENCTQYLSGRFMFIIRDTRYEKLFAAVDQRATIPLFYAYTPQKYFIASNIFSYITSYCTTLTLNEDSFLRFAFDTFSHVETCYREIKKLAPGTQLIIYKKELAIKQYWHLQNYKKSLPCRTREEYYAAFYDCFNHAVKNCLRVNGPIITQCSGGLDSSSVTALAANTLSKKNQTFYALTAIPIGLHGISYRKNWYYHEMPRVQTLLNRYPNIIHHQYIANSTTDMFAKLKNFYDDIDQPIRNIANFNWVLGSYEYVLANNGCVLLTGASGNGTISWAGYTLKNFLGNCYFALKNIVKPSKLYGNFFTHINPNQLISKQGKKLLRDRGVFFSARDKLMSGHLTAGLRSSCYAMELHYGVRVLDPTADDIDLVSFCYNTPNWVCCCGSKTLHKRLLIREGLKDILPTEIAQNPFRGEQAADWYLQYNTHQSAWKNVFNGLDPKTKNILWHHYNEKIILSIFEKYPYLHTPPDQKITAEVNMRLMRVLSAGFFLDHLIGGLRVY